MTHLLIAHRHRLWRDAVRTALSLQPALRVTAEAEDGPSSVQLARQVAPDVAILDMALPKLNGMATAGELRSSGCEAQVILILSQRQCTLAPPALAAGIAGLFLHEASLEELVTAIRRVSAGRRYISAPLADLIIEDVAGRLRSQESDGPRRQILTLREREVLQLLAEGHLTKDIARALHVSPRTVETHRSHIMRKLDLHSLAHLTKYAIREGLTAIDT
ncbi:MAG: LuxR C-terminal-related transcriptional regulator [Candidatus Eiseniibacteriota bacterium]